MAEEEKVVKVVDDIGKNVFTEDGYTIKTLNNLTSSFDDMANTMDMMTEGFDNLAMSISNLNDSLNKFNSMLETILEMNIFKVKLKKLVKRKIVKRRKR
jgi:hypothetical protein